MTVVSSFWVNVDPTNPGQFFACCGLLELADRLWAGSEGWFGNDGRQFHLACGRHSLHELLTALANLQVETVSQFIPSGVEIPEMNRPLKLVFPTNPPSSMQIDAWVKLAVDKGAAVVRANPPWNFWSGQQKSFGIWTGLHKEFQQQLPQVAPADLVQIFFLRSFLEKGRFGFDAGPAWNALDVGFSPNEQSIEVESSPAIELLAAIGVQRFRPVMNMDRNAFSYHTWDVPLSTTVSAAAAAGSVDVGKSKSFLGTVVQRGQFAALGLGRVVS